FPAGIPARRHGVLPVSRRLAQLGQLRRSRVPPLSYDGSLDYSVNVRTLDPRRVHAGDRRMSDAGAADTALDQLFLGDSEMARRMRAFDWAKTPIGPVSSWSPTLRMMVPFLLANRFPLLLWWGSEYIQLYNDAYAPILGKKHPHPGLGRSVRECWSEVWHVL